MVDEKSEFFSDRPFGIDSFEECSSEMAVSIFIKRFPEVGSIKELKSLCKSKTASQRVTLAWLSEEFSSFPVRMVYKKVPWVRDMWDGLYNKFKKTYLYSEWEEEENKCKLEGDTDRPMVIAFSWPKWKTCCIHNCESAKYGGSLGSAISNKSKDVFKIIRSFSEETFVIEPFDQFLESISWSK